MKNLLPNAFETVFKAIMFIAICSLSYVVAEDMDRNEIVKVFGGDVIVKEGESCENVVVIGGNADVRGDVISDIVIIGGQLTMSGSAGENVVVIGGKAIIKSTAQISEDLVIIGAEPDVDKGVIVGGDRVTIARWISGVFDGLKSYVIHCLLKGRFFAISLPWTMAVLGATIALMFILAFLFPAFFTKNIELAENKIVTALIIGILIPVAIGPVLIALSVTIIGIPAIPVLIILLKGSLLIGILALSTHVGKQVIRMINPSFNMPVMFSALIGVILFSAIMVIPFVGGIFTVILTTIGTGTGIYALIDLIRMSQIKKPLVNDQQVNQLPVSQTVTELKQDDLQNQITDSVPATFIQRAGAALIDIVLIMLVYGITFAPFMEHTLSLSHHHGGPIKLLLMLTYLVLMWNWKQTTIGGIVFRLKICRVDDSRFTIGVAVVRALGLLLSIVPLGLGFLWIAWDERHQGWHDKIAGTVVYQVNEKMSII